MDEMVLKTQQWLNSTYSGHSGYNPLNLNDSSIAGRTGWTTIYALTRALQIELGITSTADNFGPTTQAKFSAKYPKGIQQQSDGDAKQDNIYAIVQGALWCKGYGTGSGEITRHFYSGTGSAIKSLKKDAYGATFTAFLDSAVTLNVMVALLSMNQYVLLTSMGGSEDIRKIQQDINNDYEEYVGLMPCDGLYGREMNKALIKVLQAIEGLTPGQATGTFGETTKAKCPIFPPGGSSKAIKLFQYALVCNGYPRVSANGVWDELVNMQVQVYQSAMKIPVTGIADLNTWMSLLLSSGNPDRAATVCDTRFEITEERADQLINLGYSIVGRYLTGGDFKELRAAEPRRILDKGLQFFPIFQESGTNLSYFTASRGKTDAINASNAAKKFGIPNATVIYFAVDTDVLDGDISTYILPYFKSVWSNIDQKYKVGLYGTRNVCTKVINAGYAVTCFVSDMSTGFSGNMGFKIPSRWNYDQFAEISLSPNWGIDKVGYSEKFPAVSYLDSEETTSDMMTVIEKISELETIYKKYYEIAFNAAPQTVPLLTSKILVLGITNFLRSQKYNSNSWLVTTGRGIDKTFVEYVEQHNKTLYNWIIPYISTDNTYVTDSINGQMDLAHLGATLECYIDSFPPEFWGGWGGDLSTAMGDVMSALTENPAQNITELAKKIIGSYTSSCNFADLCSDADAIKIAQFIEQAPSLSHPLYDAMKKYYSSYNSKRYSYYKDDFVKWSTLSELKDDVYKMMNTGMILEGSPVTVVNLLNMNNIPTDEVNRACCNVFAEYIYSRAN